MSGEELRYVAINGNWKTLRGYMLLRSNPCSTDEFGLSPLHFAVWNGHVECVKYLICNDLGIDKNGVKKSCLNLISTMGLTGK